MYNPNLFRDITINLEEGSIRLPLYKIFAAIAEQFAINEIISFTTPFGKLTLKT